jgi:hypothetical protein
LVDVLIHIGLGVWYAIAAAIAIAFFTWVYLSCCGPGMGLWWLVHLVSVIAGLTLLVLACRGWLGEMKW